MKKKKEYKETIKYRLEKFFSSTRKYTTKKYNITYRHKSYRDASVPTFKDTESFLLK